MKKPLVSVIIPNYNYAKYVGEAIDSALNQTYENLEIIVVDDGSKDNSREILESYGDKIKVIFQENAGVSAARNNGVKNSNGKYIAFLDADDIWFSEKIAKQVNVLEKNEDVGLVDVGLEEFDNNGNIISSRLDGLSGWVSNEFLLLERSVVLGAASGMMLPRKVFDEVGGFDLNLLTSADWDFCYRVNRLYKIKFIPEVLIRYRNHGTNMHSNVKRMEREMFYGFEKAFSENSSDIQTIKQRSYSNLHKILAGSYFHNREYKDFIKHTFRSIYLYPKNLKYFIDFPKRVLRRKKD